MRRPKAHLESPPRRAGKRRCEPGDPRFYRMMGDRFYLGYDFTSEDGTPGGDRVVILAHAMWKRLGADPAIIGATLLMDGEPYTVVGVLAPGLRDRGAPVTVPLVFKPEHSIRMTNG
jgi:putative ABC transport system permease protein